MTRASAGLSWELVPSEGVVRVKGSDRGEAERWGLGMSDRAAGEEPGGGDLCDTDLAEADLFGPSMSEAR
jgi:hypothetical protein